MGNILLFLSLFFITVESKNILIINVLGKHEFDEMLSLKNALNFTTLLKKDYPKFYHSAQIKIYVHKYKHEAFLNVTDNLYYYTKSSIESIQSVIESISSTISSTSSTLSSIMEYTKLISLCITSSIIIMPSSNFMNIFKKLESNKSKVLLLHKTQRLTSVSDWSDLFIFGLSFFPQSSDKKPHGSSISSSVKWFETFQRIYTLYSTDRDGLSMKDPRPALLETNFQFQKNPLLEISYFARGEICVYSTSPTTTTTSSSTMTSTTSNNYCHKRSKGGPITTIICNILLSSSGTSSSTSFTTTTTSSTSSSSSVRNTENYDCVTVDEPLAWKKNIDRRIDSLGGEDYRHSKTELLTSDWSSKLHEKADLGTLRFALGVPIGKPAPFCWENKNSKTETPTTSRIYYNSYNESSLFVHKPITSANRHPHHHHRQPPYQILILTGSHGSAYSLDYRLYPSIAKMYYAKRHGYKFMHRLSNQFKPYFRSTWQDLKGSSGVSYTSNTLAGYMSKILMLIDTMLRSPDIEWIAWFDDDTWINPRFLDIPLESYLDNVPDDKLVVTANFRALFTNLLFIRNSERGRQLAYDWLAIAKSGTIQCHGFDQAALQMLLLIRLQGNFSHTPLGYSCRWSTDQLSGCNNVGDWTCDWKFEKALFEAGFVAFHKESYGEYSSFSKGCANDHIPDFHIVSETLTRPKLQCNYCTDLDRIEGDGRFCQQSPLCGAGNDVLRRNAVNGWFANHKLWALFFESYLNSSNCKYEAQLVPPCRVTASGRRPVDRRERRAMIDNGDLISLADGYAYDLRTGSYCAVDAVTLEYQKNYSYMKSYNAIFKSLKQYEGGGWNKQYQMAIIQPRKQNFSCSINEYNNNKQQQQQYCKNGLKIFPYETDFEPIDFCNKQCVTVYNEKLVGERSGKRLSLNCNNGKV